MFAVLFCGNSQIQEFNSRRRAPPDSPPHTRRLDKHRMRCGPLRKVDQSIDGNLSCKVSISSDWNWGSTSYTTFQEICYTTPEEDLVTYWTRSGLSYCVRQMCTACRFRHRVSSRSRNSVVSYGWGSISPGRQVLLNQSWVGMWSRRIVFQPLPGIV